MTNRKRGYLLILVAAVLYSTTEVVLKGLGDTFAPMQVTVERVLIGAVALLPFALKNLKKRNIRLTRSDYGYFALMGFLTVLLHMSLLQMAVLHMDASATSIIYSGNPVFAVAAAHVILHEPLRKNHLLAIALEVVGILFILNPAHMEISLRGFLEIITATLLFALYGTLCKLRVSRLGGIVIADFNILLGGLEMLAVLLAKFRQLRLRCVRSGSTSLPRCRFSRVLRSSRRCFCAMSASAARPSVFCSRRRSRSTPLRRRRRSFISSSPFWQRRWRLSCTTSISA